MTVNQRTAGNVAIVSLAALVQIVIQFLFQRVLAGLYGTGVEADAFAAALVVPTMFAAIITGSLGYVLVPELVGKFSGSETEDAGWRLAAVLGVVTSAAGIGVGLILWSAAEPICEFLYGQGNVVEQSSSVLPDSSVRIDSTVLSDAKRLPEPGRPSVDGHVSTAGLTGRLLRILSIQVFLSGLISWAQTVHHSRHRFFLPALGGVCGTSLTLWIASQYGQQGIFVIAWAIVAGSAISALVHMLPLLPRFSLQRNPAYWLDDYPSVLRLTGLLWPLVLGAAFLRVDPLVDRVLAARLAVEQPGAIAEFNYAHRITLALLAIGTSGLSVVAFPQLAGRLAGEGYQAFAAQFACAFRRLILLVVPIALGFSLFAERIVGDLLEQGEFTSHDTRQVARVIVAFMGLFVGASCGDLLARAYYVMGDTRTPTLIGAAALVLGLWLKVGLYTVAGTWGIALAASIYLLVAAIVMAWDLVRRTREPLFAGSRTALVQSLIATTLACGCSFLAYNFMGAGTLGAAPTGACVYLLVLLGLHNPDARLLLGVVKRRFGKQTQTL